MTDDDVPKFEKIFRGAYLAAQAKWPLADYKDRVGLYFRRLRCAPVEDVAKAAATWFETNKKFPAMSEWLALLTNKTTAARPPDQRVMGVTEIAEWNAARECKYHRAPCTCLACQAAGVDTFEQRYVPIEDRDGYVQAWHSGRNEMVHVGEWIHGEPLKRWYAAKQACADRIAQMAPPLRRLARKLLPLEDRIALIFQDADGLTRRSHTVSAASPEDVALAQRLNELQEINDHIQRARGREPGEDDQ